MSFRETVEAMQRAPERGHFKFKENVFGVSHASANLGTGRVHDLVFSAANASLLDSRVKLCAGYRPAEAAVGFPEKIEVTADRGFRATNSAEITEGNFEEYTDLAGLIRQLVQASLENPVELRDTLEEELQGLL